MATDDVKVMGYNHHEENTGITLPKVASSSEKITDMRTTYHPDTTAKPWK
ncbi:unnamed protein product [Trichogramma brassicae]|uniref:Uncharacterized protein n=1 Tax=Trichogramma brassicae TaxID=86971 RepID=A0A6H5HWR5_9HYME|nr:unnamed protein product [Trichogramma brassicae]